MKQEKTKITLKIDGVKTSVKFEHSDVTMDELFNAFKTLCVGATFNCETFDNYIMEIVESLKPMENE
jgi:hypothetical protein